jgi:hypothetical protein
MGALRDQLHGGVASADAPIRATLEIPGTPSSLNAVGYRSHWAVGRREKQRWEQDIATALMVAKVPRRLDWVTATAAIHFTQRRRRDEANFRPLIDKALGDVLQSGWGLPDDTPEYYCLGAVELVAPSPEPLTVITLDYEK